MRGPRNAMADQKPRNFKKTMGTLIRGYLKPYIKSLIFVAFSALISAVFSVVSPMIMGNATDLIASGASSGMMDFEKLFSICIVLLSLYLITSLFTFLQGFIMSGVCQKITYQLRENVSRKIDRLPLKYYDTKSHGEILSRITNDIETISQSLNQSLTQTITSVATLIGVIIFMLSISPIMALTCFIVLPLSAILIGVVIKRSQIYFKQQQQFLGELNGHVEEMYTGHLIVKAYNGEQDSIEKFEKHNDNLYQTAWKSQFLSGLMMPITVFVGNLGYVFVCVVGGLLALRGQVTIGGIQAFLQYVRLFNQPVSQVAQIANMLQSTTAAAERVFELLDEEEEINETSAPVTLSPEKCQGHVVFDHVKFGYDSDKIVIRDFNYEVYPGMKVAIVGPTGAGKTTLVKLLMRFYELHSGSIFIDGIDSKEMTRSDLRSLFGMVLQDAWLFSGTIKENIRYGKPNATDEEIMRAAKAAQITHFINTFPEGYDTLINEDASNISQGQKQLLTIARAILSDAPIMILDEATSSVDTRTEVLIQTAMQNLMKDRTSFIIAHRLSTIRDADTILVIRDGDIVETGNHVSLMAENGFYANLYNSQF